KASSGRVKSFASGCASRALLAPRVFEKPSVGRADALRKRNPRLPANTFETRDIEQFSRRAIRLRDVVLEPSGESDHLCNEPRELSNRHVAAEANVDVLFLLVEPHEIDERVGKVVDVQEFAPRLAGAPQHNAFGPASFGLLHFAYQRWQHVAG